jgi:hypothetical protein
LPEISNSAGLPFFKSRIMSPRLKMFKPGVTALATFTMTLPKLATPDPWCGVARKTMPTVLVRMLRYRRFSSASTIACRGPSAIIQIEWAWRRRPRTYVFDHYAAKRVADPDDLAILSPTSQHAGEVRILEGGLNLISLPDVFDPLQESDSQLVDARRLEDNIGRISIRPYASRVGVGLVSDAFGKEILEPDGSRVWVPPRAGGSSMEAVDDEDTLSKRR